METTNIVGRKIRCTITKLSYSGRSLPPAWLPRVRYMWKLQPLSSKPSGPRKMTNGLHIIKRTRVTHNSRRCSRGVHKNFSNCFHVMSTPELSHRYSFRVSQGPPNPTKVFALSVCIKLALQVCEAWYTNMGASII